MYQSRKELYTIIIASLYNRGLLSVPCPNSFFIFLRITNKNNVQLITLHRLAISSYNKNKNSVVVVVPCGGVLGAYYGLKWILHVHKFHTEIQDDKISDPVKFHQNSSIRK